MSLLKKDQLQKSAGLLNSVAPEDHFLAYITGEEKNMLVAAGGKETPTVSGINAYPPGMGDPNYDGSGGGTYSGSGGNQGGQGPAGGASAGGNYGGNSSGGTSSNNMSGAGGGNNQDSDETSWSAEDHTPTGWTGDSGVDAHESNINDSLLGTPDYQGTIFTGGTYATDHHPASRTIKYGNDAASEDQGRPDITYIQPTGTIIGNYKSKYEMNQIKHIQDSKLQSVKNKLKLAGFTDIPKDANFEEVKEYVKTLNRTGKIGDSWKNAVDKHGNQLYDDATIEKWEKEGYVPQSVTMKAPGLLGPVIKKASPTGTLGAPLTYDQLMNDFKQMEEVGKSGGGEMDWKERMKTYSPKQYEALTGTIYNPHTKTYKSRDKMGGGEDDRLSRVSAPYEVGGTTPPQESQAAKWYASLGNTSSNTLSFQAQYNTAKTKQASILGTPSPMRWLAVSQSPFFDFLKENKLDRGIL